jgi:putative flippase GtrA
MSGRQLLSFGVVGALGFVVDTAALYAAIGLLGAGLYLGRAISFLTAASFTWALNRRYTFAERRGDNRVAEWGRFLAANAVGGAVNYATYALLVTMHPVAAANPVIGVAAGSVAGLAINFVLSRSLVFRGGQSPD